jgi:hypothetical protein
MGENMKSKTVERVITKFVFTLAMLMEIEVQFVFTLAMLMDIQVQKVEED